MWAFLQFRGAGLHSSCDVRASCCGDFFCWGAQAPKGRASVVAARGLRNCASQVLEPTGSVVVYTGSVAHKLFRPTACGILPDQGSNPCLLHWQADSYPKSHQGNAGCSLECWSKSSFIFKYSSASPLWSDTSPFCGRLTAILPCHLFLKALYLQPARPYETSHGFLSFSCPGLTLSPSPSSQALTCVPRSDSLPWFPDLTSPNFGKESALP